MAWAPVVSVCCVLALACSSKTKTTGTPATGGSAGQSGGGAGGSDAATGGAAGTGGTASGGTGGSAATGGTGDAATGGTGGSAATGGTGGTSAQNCSLFGVTWDEASKVLQYCGGVGLQCVKFTAVCAGGSQSTEASPFGQSCWNATLAGCATPSLVTVTHSPDPCLVGGGTTFDCTP